MQCLEINSIKVHFDKEKTQKNITPYNEPCDCQDCRNYYKIVESNMELREFLSQFGIDYLRCEEVISYDFGEEKDSLIHSMAYYDVFGSIEKEFSIEKEGYTISFKKNEDINVGHEVDDEYFWIVLDMVIPYVLEEERELSYVSDKTNIFTKAKELVFKLFKPKKYDKQIPEKWSWESIVEMMYDNGLDAFEDEVVKVVYSKDKSMRYVILKDEYSIFTYQLEAIYQYNDGEWQYICDSDDTLPVMWEPHNDNSSASSFANEEDLMKELIREPEYKQFFS